MKTILSFLMLLLANSSHAESVTQQSVIRAYVLKAQQVYAQTLEGARQTQKSIEVFLTDPSEENLRIARETWTEARKLYSQSEIYRFYGGPIDREGGPEPFINAWPLDEVYIDQIIADQKSFPNLDIKTLKGLNEKDGEKNISTGWHAIEYMLWGQDLSETGPGARPATDYQSQNPLAMRRAEYLRTISQALVSDLETVQREWDLNRKGSYAQQFLNSKDALANMLLGVVKMSGAELSQERMYVALDTRAQEEEHSCFSDTTHFDIYFNFIGIKNVLKPGIIDLVRQKDKSVAEEIEENLQAAEEAIQRMETPFDRAILTETGRASVMNAISALETLTESVKQGARTLGITTLP